MKKLPKNVLYLVGIDEVGRGPLAGPVTVGACAVGVDFDKKFFKGLRDSKKLSSAKREAWLEKIDKQKKLGNLNYKITSVDAKVIDSKGLSFCIKFALKKSLLGLKLDPKKCFIFLDGGLKAPKEFIYQQTIIKGDEKIAVISLASIVAKVTRDKNMVALAKKYPQFNFEIHKGYGTVLHRQKIKQFGPCLLHRKSFLKNIL